MLRALLLFALAGCFSKPDAPGATARLVRNAWYSNNYPLGGPAMGPLLASPGMSTSGYSIDTAGIVDDDIVLFIGAIDNGNLNNDIWKVPLGFTQLEQRFFGHDGETFVVGWKLARGEPTTYSAAYGNGVFSAAATITLIAVSGASTAAPSSTNGFTDQTSKPTFARSDGLATVAANTTLIFAAGADWDQFVGTTTFTPPAGYTQLAAFGDHGDGSDVAGEWDWTSQQVSFAVQHTPGPTGVVSAEFVGTEMAGWWTMLIAIESAQ